MSELTAIDFAQPSTAPDFEFPAIPCILLPEPDKIPKPDFELREFSIIPLYNTLPEFGASVGTGLGELTEIDESFSVLVDHLGTSVFTFETLDSPAVTQTSVDVQLTRVIVELVLCCLLLFANVVLLFV